MNVYDRILQQKGVSVGATHTVQEAQCRVDASGNVFCDFPRGASGGLPEGCCIDPKTRTWVCEGFPAHGTAAPVKSIHTDKAGQAWATTVDGTVVPACVQGKPNNADAGTSSPFSPVSVGHNHGDEPCCGSCAVGAPCESDCDDHDHDHEGVVAANPIEAPASLTAQEQAACIRVAQEMPMQMPGNPEPYHQFRASHPEQTPAEWLTNVAYWRTYPKAPLKIDPDDASHRPWATVWMRLFHCVSARLPQRAGGRQTFRQTRRQQRQRMWMGGR